MIFITQQFMACLLRGHLLQLQLYCGKRVAKMCTSTRSQAASADLIAAVKDAGRVRVGNGMLRFDAPKPEVKDAGRVRVGNGMLRF